MPSNNGVVPHNQQPIHERHQNLTALLSSNSPQKDNSNVSNMQTSMGNSLLNTYSGPGPGPYPNTMMSNGPSMGNYVSSSYNTVSSGYMNTSSQMYSQTTPSSATYSLSSSMGPSMGGNVQQSSMNMQPPPPQQQSSAMFSNQPMHQSSNMGGMMNGLPIANNGTNRMVGGGNAPPNQPSQPVVSILFIKFSNCCSWAYANIFFTP